MLTLRRKSRTAPPPPDGFVDGLPSGLNLYPERHKRRSLLGYSAKSLAGAIFWPLVATMLINAASLKDWALTACSGAEIVCSTINRVCGDPLGGLKEKLGYGKSSPTVTIPPKTPQQLEAERARRRAELVAEADALGLSWKEDWPLEKLEVEVREGKDRKRVADARAREEERERKRREAAEQAALAEDRAEEEARQAQLAAEASERAELIERATVVGLGVNPKLSLREMRRQVQAAERKAAANDDFQLQHRLWEKAMAAWRDRVDNGRNAICPNCSMPCHVSPSSDQGKIVMCLNCKYCTSRAVFRAGFTPPPPPVEPQPPTLEALDVGGEEKPDRGGFLSGLTGGFQ